MKDLLVKFNPDVVILQESKVSTVDHQLVKSVWSSRFVGWAALEAYGSSSGICNLEFREVSVLLCLSQSNVTYLYRE